MSLTPIVGGTLDGKSWPGTPPATFVQTITGEAYALTDGVYVRDGGSDVAPVSTPEFQYEISNQPAGASGRLALRSYSLLGAAPGDDYTIDIYVTGGVGPYVCEVESGVLPSSLDFQSNDPGCSLTGNIDMGSDGTYNFVIKATDSLGATGTQGFTISVNTPYLMGVITNAFSGEAVTTVGGEVLSSAIAIPSGATCQAHVVSSQTTSAGTPATALKLYVSNTEGGEYSEVGAIPSMTTVHASSDALIPMADLYAVLGAAYVKIGATVSGTAAGALVTSNILWVVPAS